MNPLLKVNPKLITIINSQPNLVTQVSSTEERINHYINACKQDVYDIKKETEMQHLVPRFLLKDFEGVSGKYSNRLSIIEYRINNLRKISFGNIPDVTSNYFSVKKNFYTTYNFSEKLVGHRTFAAHDEYRMEKLLSIIERNAAPMLKFRQTKESYNSKFRNNPYIYPKEIFDVTNDNNSHQLLLDSVIWQRIAIATFFAAQYLRSFMMYKNFMNLKSPKYNKEGYEDLREYEFSDFIEEMLPQTVIRFYTRTWRWVYSSFDNAMPEGTSIIPLTTEFGKEYLTGEEESLIMPFGRYTAIYFLNLNTFYDSHDGVFISDSLAFSIWSKMKLTTALAFDMSLEPCQKRQTRKVKLCMHPEANLSYVLETGQPMSQLLEGKMDSLSKTKITSINDFNLLGRIKRL